MAPRFIIILATIVCSCHFQSNKENDNNSQTTVFKNINAEELDMLKEEHADLQLVDVRTPQEVEEGKISGAENINFKSEDFERQIGILDKEKPVVVYCASGKRSTKAANTLHDSGFKEVYNFSEGYEAWKDYKDQKN